jgi:hypothetical protein
MVETLSLPAMQGGHRCRPGRCRRGTEEVEVVVTYSGEITYCWLCELNDIDEFVIGRTCNMGGHVHG